MKKQWEENDICIYGLGGYGLRTYFFLKEYDIQITCFGDRDERKCGYALEGIECRKYEEVIEYNREQWTIIVAIENPEKLVKHFKNLGFQHTLSFKQIINILPEQHISCEMKKYNPITDIETVRRFKKNLEHVLTYGTKLEELDNIDMQLILEDCLKRQRGKDKYCESN